MVWHGLTSFFARIKITILGHAFPDGGQPCPRHHTNPECNETMVGQRKKAPTARGTSFTSPVPRDARSWVDRWWVEVGNMSESGQNNEVCDGLCRKWSSLRLAGWLRNPRSAKFTLNSKRFPRLKSTFPLWLNLQSSPRYIQNGFQPSSHFFLDRKPFELVLCLLLGWTLMNYLCRRCSNALGSRGLGMLKKLFRA